MNLTDTIIYSIHDDNIKNLKDLKNAENSYLGIEDAQTGIF